MHAQLLQASETIGSRSNGGVTQYGAGMATVWYDSFNRQVNAGRICYRLVLWDISDMRLVKQGMASFLSRCTKHITHLLERTTSCTRLNPCIDICYLDHAAKMLPFPKFPPS